jgi:hypothetical protein
VQPHVGTVFTIDHSITRSLIGGTIRARPESHFAEPDA